MNPAATDGELDIRLAIKERKRTVFRIPHTLIGQVLPQEFIDLANEKMAAINTAYDRIEKERGLR